MIFRKITVMGAAIAIGGGLGLAIPTAVGAAGGYPGTTTVTTVPPSSTTTTQGTTPGGSTNPGGSSQSCVATVTTAVGNTSVVVLSGCTPNSTYSITVVGVVTGLTVNSDGSGTVTLTNAVSDPHLSVNGSTPEPSVYGSNTVTLTNTKGGSGGAEYVIIPNATTAAIGSGGTNGSSGTLAFTGADLLALIVGALFLLLMGTLLVVFTRRRASHQQI